MFIISDSWNLIPNIVLLIPWLALWYGTELFLYSRQSYDSHLSNQIYTQHICVKFDWDTEQKQIPLFFRHPFEFYKKKFLRAFHFLSYKDIFRKASRLKAVKHLFKVLLKKKWKLHDLQLVQWLQALMWPCKLNLVLFDFHDLFSVLHDQATQSTPTVQKLCQDKIKIYFQLLVFILLGLEKYKTAML